MIIESLTMKNFKSHRDTHVDFSTGISVIMGENGAGKSSILEAVSFALFKQHSGKKIEQLIRIGQKKKMVVDLQFQTNGRTYLVSRERDKSSSKSVLKIKEGNSFQTILSGEKQVTNEIQNMLDMDGDLFLNAVYVRQGEIADLIDKAPSEKKQMIGKLLGIEALEKTWKNMLPLINNYEIKKENITGRLESMEGLKENLKAKIIEKDDISSKIQLLNVQIGKMGPEFELMKEKKELLDEKRSEFKRIKSAIESKKQLLNRAENDKNVLNNEVSITEDKEAQLRSIKPKIENLDLLHQLKDVSGSLKNLQEDEKRIQKGLEDIQKFKSILDENHKFYRDYLDIGDNIKLLEDERLKFEGSRTLMKQCTSQKSQVQDKIQESTEKIVKSLKDANKVLRTDFSRVEELENHIKSIKPSTEAKVEEIRSRINDFQQDISNLKTHNKNLEKPVKELENVKDKCPVCKSTISPDKRDELIEGYDCEIKSNKDRIFQLDHELKGLKSQKHVLTSKFAEIQNINVDILKERIKTLEQSQKELESISSDLEGLEPKVSKLDEIDSLLKEKKTKQNEIKGKYESYISAKGSLESLGDYDSKNEDLKKIKAEIVSMKVNVDQLTEKSGTNLKSLESKILELENLKNKYNHLSGEISQKNSLIEKLNLLDKDITGIKEETVRLDNELESIGYNEDIHSSLQMNLYNKSQELTDLIGQKKELIGKESGILDRIKELESEVEVRGKYQGELKNLKDFIKLLNHIRDLYGKDGVQRDLRNISRPLIEQNTREFFEKFNFEYSDIKLDEDYDVTVYGPAGKNSLDMISGGERIAVALALRLGITQALSGGNLELVMLDEPTIHLDSYRRQELIDLLKKMSIIPQMIIVTHDPDLEEAADTILRVKKEKGESLILES
jgi:DNA repair protein SbcC/Rad50